MILQPAKAVQTTSVDPALMSAKERFREVAALLATAYRRLSECSQNPLDDAPNTMAPCHPVNTRRTLP